MNVFIVGAGFTKAIFPDAPLNSELINILAARKPQSALADLRDRYGTDDIEIGLTKLDTDITLLETRSDSEANYLIGLRRRIEHELVAHFRSFCASDDQVTSSQWLKHLIQYAFCPGDVVVSLNYDCVVEGALDYCGKWSANGGYGSSIDNPLANGRNTPKSQVTVLKLHGSANFVIAPYADNPAVEAVNYEFDERFFPNSAKHMHFGFGAGTGRGYVIAPSYVKIPTVEITYLMVDALEATTTANNLVVIGSSLRPEDAFLSVLTTSFLKQPSWRSRKIIILDPAAQSIGDRLKRFWAVDLSEQILPIAGRLQESSERLIRTVCT